MVTARDAKKQTREANEYRASFNSILSAKDCFLLVCEFQAGVPLLVHQYSKLYLLDGKVYDPETGVSRDIPWEIGDVCEIHEQNREYQVCTYLSLSTEKFDMSFPLHIAIAEKNVELAKMIATARPDMVSQGTAVCAVTFGLPDLAMWLWDKPTLDILECPNDTLSPIVKNSMYNNRVGTLHLLHALGYRFLVSLYAWPLAKSNHAEIEEFIFTNWEMDHHDYIRIALCAIDLNNPRLLARVLEDACNQGPDNWRIISDAIGRSGFVELVPLGSRIFSVEAMNRIMHAALVNGQVKMAQYMHSALGIAGESSDWNFVVRTGNLDLMKWFAQQHDDLPPADNIWTPVHSLEAIEFLVALGYDIKQVLPAAPEVAEYMLKRNNQLRGNYIMETLRATKSLGEKKQLKMLKFYETHFDTAEFGLECIAVALGSKCTCEVFKCIIEKLRSDEEQARQMQKMYDDLLTDAVNSFRHDLIEYLYGQCGAKWMSGSLDYAIQCSRMSTRRFILENMDQSSRISDGVWRQHLFGYEIEILLKKGVQHDVYLVVEKLAGIGQVDRLQRLEDIWCKNICFANDEYHKIIKESLHLGNTRMVEYLLKKTLLFARHVVERRCKDLLSQIDCEREAISIQRHREKVCKIIQDILNAIYESIEM